MTPAELISAGDRPSVRLTRILNETPESVWTRLTDTSQIRSWFPCEILIEGGEWKVGAKLRFPFPPEMIDMTLNGEVLAFDEQHVLAFSWGPDDILRFEIAPQESGTCLVVTDELTASIAARNAAGWEICLDQMQGIEPEPDTWRRHFDAYSAAFSPQLGPQDGPPTDYKGEP